jgi:hypothetical protein
MSSASLNLFERAILDWVAERTSDTALSTQLQSATVKRRDYTRTGFFVYLIAEDQCENVGSTVRPQCPHITISELMDGAGCNLFLRNGRLHYLEIYARGGFIPETVDVFKLEEEQ